ADQTTSLLSRCPLFIKTSACEIGLHTVLGGCWERGGDAIVPPAVRFESSGGEVADEWQSRFHTRAMADDFRGASERGAVGDDCAAWGCISRDVGDGQVLRRSSPAARPKPAIG